MKRFLVLFVAALSLCSCNWFGNDEEERHALLIYFAANNSLSSYGEQDMRDLQAAWLPETKDKRHIVMVYHHFTDNTPRLVRLSRDRKGDLVEDVIQEYPFETNSADTRTLSAVIADAEEAWPAAEHGIVLWSHASGFLPPGYFGNPKESASRGDGPMATYFDPYAHMVKSFGEDNQAEIDIRDLRVALQGIHYDYLLFDCCFMGDLQAVFELAPVTDLIVCSPTEILGDGLCYDTLVESVFGTDDHTAAMRKVCTDYMAQYRAQSGDYASATITLVNTAGLADVARTCKPIFAQSHDQIMTLDRSKVQAYFRFPNLHWFYDVDDLIQRIATESQYADFKAALDKAVIFKDSTPAFLGLDIRHYSGLSIYIPRPEYTVLNNYYKTLRWNAATGYIE